MKECFYLLADIAPVDTSRFSELGLNLVSACMIPSRFKYPYRSLQVLRAVSADWAEVLYFSKPGTFFVPARPRNWNFQTFCMKCIYASFDPSNVVKEFASYIRHAVLYGNPCTKENASDVSEFMSETLARLDLDFAVLGVSLPPRFIEQAVAANPGKCA